MYKQITSFILALALVAGAGLIAPNESLARGAKSITTEIDGYTVKGKKCLIKKRCDFKFFVKKRQAPPQQYSTHAARECLKVNGVCIEGKFVKKSPGVFTAEHPKSLRYGYGGRGGWGHGPRYYGPGYDPGAAVVGGIIGGALVNWWNRPEPPPPPPPPEPEPAPVDTGTVVLEPFTPDWYEYCGNKYQSFDPKTGFYVSLEGGKKFCR